MISSTKAFSRDRSAARRFIGRRRHFAFLPALPRQPEHERRNLQAAGGGAGEGTLQSHLLLSRVLPYYSELGSF